MSRWFRHYAGMMRDDKLVRIAIKTKQPIERVLWIWGAILESAAEIDDNGRYDLDAEEIAYFLRADVADVEAVLRGMEAGGHIAALTVVRWGDRQFQSDRSAERQRRHRDKKRAQSADERDDNDEVTSLSRHGDTPETETETETDSSEAKASSPRARAENEFPCPEGVDQIDWQSLLANRKQQRAPMNAGAYRQILQKLERWSRDGWPPGPIVAYAVERGWRTVFETDEMKHGNAQHHIGKPRQTSDGGRASGWLS